MKKTILYLLFLGLLTLLLPLTSCSPSYPSSSSYVTMDKIDMTAFIIETNHINALQCYSMNDQQYAIPTIKWIEKDFSSELKKFLFKYQVTSATDTSNDCDDFTQYAITVGHIMFRHASKRPAESALAIGAFQYYPDGGGGHSLNFFIATDDYGVIKVVLYEPQTQQIIQLYPKDTVIFWEM